MARSGANDPENEKAMVLAAIHEEGDAGYADTVKESLGLAGEKAFTNDSKAWISIGGHNVFVHEYRLRQGGDPVALAKELAIPVLVMHGKEDLNNFSEEATILMDGLRENKAQCNLVLYKGLGHFFGDLVRDGKRRDHFEVNSDVPIDIVSWLKKNLTPPPAPEVEVVEEEILGGEEEGPIEPEVVEGGNEVEAF